ncbi:hypothetical protein F5B20DRAFT_494965 [Whalleya microplaca]|nr:hypothetical protein F5B20DRAFT_494965 [Whalleya microplaca]
MAPDRSHADEEVTKHLASSQLSLLISPVLPDEKIRSLSMPAHTKSFDELQDLEALGDRYDVREIPMFEKRSTLSNLELFYDLWFVANFSTFSSVHEVTSASQLWSYVGYISLLWLNWFLVSMFDVRFITDSIFERVARTCHLGVMVGFAIVATNFDPDEQTKGVFQGLSLILMFSRLVLATEYLTIIWHIRRFRKGKIALSIVTAFHFFAALVYFGISFCFRNGYNSMAYAAWYVVSLSEAILQLSISLFAKVLSFDGTHLTERLTTLTIIVLGEGVTSIIANIVLIVQNNGWTSETMGVLTSGIATVYIVFLLYFDWMGHHHHLTGFYQLLWSILHFPFHIMLVLFVEGATQFIRWWKILEVQSLAVEFFTVFDKATDGPNGDTATQDVVDQLNGTVQDIWAMYPPTYRSTTIEIEKILANVSTIPNNVWSKDNVNSPYYFQFIQDISDLLVTVINSVFVNFKIDPILDSETQDPSKLQYEALEQTSMRFVLVFQYVFTSAGLSLILMTLMHMIVTKRRWTPLNCVRTGLFLLIGAGLALVCLVSLNFRKQWAYLDSPWLLPTLCIVFFVVLVLTHLPHSPPLFFRRRAPRKGLGGNGAAGASSGNMLATDGMSLDSLACGHVGEDPHGYAGQTHIYTSEAPISHGVDPVYNQGEQAGDNVYGEMRTAIEKRE